MEGEAKTRSLESHSEQVGDVSATAFVNSILVLGLRVFRVEIGSEVQFINLATGNANGTIYVMRLEYAKSFTTGNPSPRGSFRSMGTR